jgi:predicted permease
MGIKAVQGRTFNDTDAATSEPVAIINETSAKLIWPEGNAVGQRVRTSQRRPWMTIVGVVRDVHSTGLDQAAPAELYVMHEQRLATAGGAERTLFLVIRTVNEPMVLAPATRAAVKEIDPLLAIASVRPMHEIMELSMARPRFAMRLLTAFGALALVLAAIGIYGIMAYGVKRRTREIGIRMALGAQRSSVLTLIVSQGMRLTVIGLAAGTLAAFLITRYMETLLYGVKPFDPVTFAGVVGLLAAVALVASWIPARRAVAGDTVVALRE